VTCDELEKKTKGARDERRGRREEDLKLEIGDFKGRGKRGKMMNAECKVQNEELRKGSHGGTEARSFFNRR
jgi:hypothetical protein